MESFMLKNLRKIILAGIGILIVLVIILSLTKPAMITDMLPNNTKETLVGKCLSSQPIEKFDSLEDANMVRVVYVGDYKYLTLHYSQPSLMNQLQGSYELDSIAKDEKINDMLLEEFYKVPCQDELKIKAFRQHRNFESVMDSANLKKIGEDEVGVVSIEYKK